MDIFCNLSEEEINFNSFIHFSGFLFRLFFLEFQPQKENANQGEKFVQFLKVFYFKFAVVTLVAGVVSLFVYVAHNLDDFANASSCFPNAVSITLIAMRISMTFSRRKAICEIFQDLSELFALRKKEGKKHHHVKPYLNGYNRLMKVYGSPVMIVLIPVLFPILPYLLNGTMKLPINYWYPFDPYRWEMFPFAYLWVNWIAWHILVFLLATDSLIYGLITVIVMEFDFLNSDLSNVRLIANHDQKKVLKSLVERHNKLLNICDKLQEIYSLIFFSSFAITSMVLCFIVFQISIASTNIEVYWFYVSFLCIAGFQVWLLCFHGQKLIDSSESLANGMYNCGWESFRKLEFKKQFIVIMVQAQRAKRLTAMGFADISLESFASILTATHSYYSLLRNFYSE